MSATYNLRSSRRRKNETSENCYLQNFLNKSHDVSDPKVHVERLKVLESSRHERFVIKESQIIPVEFGCGKSYINNSIWKIVGVVLFLISPLLYWRGDLGMYGNVFLEESRAFPSTIQKYYSDALQFLKKDTGQDIGTKARNKNMEAMVFDLIAAKSNQNESLNQVEVRDIINHHLTALKKEKTEIQEPDINFIEEQCRKDVKAKMADNLGEYDGFYSFDSFGLSNTTDYALESQGARIVSFFDTEAYGMLALKFLKYDFGVITNFFIPKYYTSKGPSLILVPWNNPGDCWAFKGSRGRVRIELSQEIIITAVSIDHITQDRILHGNLKSAPKRFSVIGVEDAGYGTPRKTNLGTYEYTISGPATQTFTIENKEENLFKRIDFIVESNHGNREYTCVYKIRVHGHN